MIHWPLPRTPSGSSPTSQSFLTLFCLSLALSTSVFAAGLPSAASDTFPACALTCTALTQASDSCATNEATYVSCFCQSTLVANFYTTPDGTCDQTCTSESDRTLLQQWYINYCNSGGSSDGSTTTTTTSTTPESASGTAGADTASSTTATAANAATQTGDPAPQTWWEGHYKWVIMVIVLILGFGIITVLGVWLKRRHDAKYPNLYHAAASSANDSRIFNRGADASPSPAPGQQATLSRRYESPNTLSIASSSRTDVIIPKSRTPAPSRLQKSSTQAPGTDDIEIREVPR